MLNLWQTPQQSILILGSNTFISVVFSWKNHASQGAIFYTFSGDWQTKKNHRLHLTSSKSLFRLMWHCCFLWRISESVQRINRRQRRLYKINSRRRGPKEQTRQRINTRRPEKNTQSCVNDHEVIRNSLVDSLLLITNSILKEKYWFSLKHTKIAFFQKCKNVFSRDHTCSQVLKIRKKKQCDVSRTQWDLNPYSTVMKVLKHYVPTAAVFIFYFCVRLIFLLPSIRNTNLVATNVPAKMFTRQPPAGKKFSLEDKIKITGRQ